MVCDCKFAYLVCDGNTWNLCVLYMLLTGGFNEFVGLISDGNTRDSCVLYLMSTDAVELYMYKSSP